MNNFDNVQAHTRPFKEFLLYNKRNRTILYLAAVASVLQFAIFKYLYPFANFIHGDSFLYIKAAEENLSVNTYLIGYSKFLRLFSVFAKPDIVLVAFQYLLIQCSSLFLLFTVFYFYKPGRVMQIILLCFLMINPLSIHLANMVSSDCFFLSISFTWFSLLLWLIFKPSNKVIIWHAVMLFIAFTVRYNALIYPLIAALAFWMSKLPLRKKIWGLGLSLVLCGWFIGFTMYQFKRLTGYSQYSPFSGWQFANNAMYAYRYVDSADRKPVPSKYHALDNMIRKFYDRTRNLAMNPSEKQQASTFYMWSKSLPLMQYRDSLFKLAKDTSATELKKWASMGPMYKEYGLHIISQYPMYFLEYFLWPNTRKYFAPPVEFLQKYNNGVTYVPDLAKNWFGYKTATVTTRMSSQTTWILDYYPILSGIINVLILFGLLYYVLLKGWQGNSIFNKIVILGGSVWFLNAGFTIYASSAALRFQSFPLFLTTVLNLILIDWIVQLMKSMKGLEDKKRVSNTQRRSPKPCHEFKK